MLEVHMKPLIMLFEKYLYFLRSNKKAILGDAYAYSGQR